MKNTTYYTHYKNKQKYIVLGVCQYQHEDIWHDAVMYKDVESGKKYVRSEDSFNDSFTILISSNKHGIL